jgi:predicted nucleic acid-binding protein
MIYCDTSVIVSALTNEVGTTIAQEWLRRQAPKTLAFSGWVETELASALAMKQRRSIMNDSERNAADQQWRKLSAPWRRMPIAEQHFAEAARLTVVGLRAGDALHLAIAVSERLELATGDDVLASVAERVGVLVHRPS